MIKRQFSEAIKQRTAIGEENRTLILQLKKINEQLDAFVQLQSGHKVLTYTLPVLHNLLTLPPESNCGLCGEATSSDQCH